MGKLTCADCGDETCYSHGKKEGQVDLKCFIPRPSPALPKALKANMSAGAGIKLNRRAYRAWAAYLVKNCQCDDMPATVAEIAKSLEYSFYLGNSEK